ncbi:MAG: putative LPS assembly protein LptD, partial [bacterium]|nr:putative LPS assembly protein LptD [bacterium]
MACSLRRLFPGMGRGLPCCLFLLIVFSQPLSAQAFDIDDRAAVSIDADTLRYDRTRRLFIADGNVLMVSEATKVTCDYAEYSDLTGGVMAQGAVTLEDAEGIVVCDRVAGNIRTGLWTFENGEMDNLKRGYLLKGDRIEKVGDETYVIQRASLSECGKERPFWEMRGKRLSITRGQYLTSRHMTLRLGGIPLLYFPYFWYPLNTERQSGFLPPVFGQGGRNGASIKLDYFLAIDSNRDATFSYDYLADNGNRF